MVEVVKPKLVIIDNLRKIFSGDENSSDIMSEVFTILNGVFKQQAVIYIHHTHKLSPPPGQKVQARVAPVDAARGSSFLTGEVDAVYLLYGNKLSTDVRFDESTEYPLVRDEHTKLWSFPEAERLQKMEVHIRSLFGSRAWDSWGSFLKQLRYTIPAIPDHLMSRLEEELQPQLASSHEPL
jgi:RecA-family ATPase